MEERSIAQLGETIKCSKDKEFAKFIRQEVRKDKVAVALQCPRCGNKFQSVYTTAEYEKMADMALVDKPDIIDYQKKMIIENAILPHLEKGMQGAFVIDEKRKGIYRMGQGLLCKCNKFYSLTIKGFKKDMIEFTAYCGDCTPKSKRILIKLEDFVPLGKAGLFDDAITNQIRDEFRNEMTAYDAKGTYRGNDGTLAPWVQESLGMSGDNPSKKCYICGNTIAEGVTRCPKCGSDIDLG